MKKLLFGIILIAIFDIIQQAMHARKISVYVYFPLKK